MSLLPKIREQIGGLGYRPEFFSDGSISVGAESTFDFVAHSRLPKDIRTAAIVVLSRNADRRQLFALARSTGAALAIEIDQQGWACSRISEHRLHSIQDGKISQLAKFFREHQNALHPDAIYRAKTWGRLDPSVRQLEFVDSGLMPIVERDLGSKVSQLLEECVQDLSGTLGWTNLTDAPASRTKAQWLIKAPFWLLAAKTLRDKQVPNFKRLNLQEFDKVYTRLAKHYNSQDSKSIQVLKNQRDALSAVADKIERFSSLELLSAEALGHVYESSVINKATRKLLGTHSTPPWLIDYIVGKLRPWIAEIPVEERVVFEPACGHAGFLVAALRLLDELRPADHSEDRIPYLRNRLYGVDIDPFSQEVARLALTLADVPNPNGWKLAEGDMFQSDIIEKTAATANIVLANPPFENFGDSKQAGWLDNKASETLTRIVHALPEGGVLGFVGPQGFLQNRQGEELRRRLLSDYEISEVTLFADKVFQYGAPESSVILARRLKKAQRATAKKINFVRVREQEIEEFAESQEAKSVETISAQELLEKEKAPLFVPMLQELWKSLENSKFQPLEQVAGLGQGFSHKGANDPTLPPDLVRESDVEFKGAVPGYSDWAQGQLLHEAPAPVFLNLASEAIRRPHHGLAIDLPQVLLNYAPVSRGPWRLKALMDEKGHPVTSRFIVVRPKDDAIALEVLWALLNSPVSNAFVFCHLSKRDNLVGKLRQIPVPKLDQCDLQPLIKAVQRYFEAALKWKPRQGADLPLFRQEKTGETSIAPSSDELGELMLRVDVEVLKLYSLPPSMERKLLDVFCGHERKGVPFVQEGYFPKELTGLNTVEELVTVTTDWEVHAARKTDLIEKKVNKEASCAELAELKELKRLSSARRDLLAPLPLAELRELHRELTQGS